MAGALLDILAKNRVSGANMTKIAEVRTDANGAYSLRVPGGPSRVLRVAYKAYLGDSEYASWTDVSQRVQRAGRLPCGDAARRAARAGARSPARSAAATCRGAAS